MISNTKKTINGIIFLVFTTFLLTGTVCCKKEEFKNKMALKKLYRIFKNGKISECKYNSETIYSATLNAYDTDEFVYSKSGKKIGSCNSAFGNNTSICKELTDCEVIYRDKNNIWGEPEVDKYKLGR